MISERFEAVKYNSKKIEVAEKWIAAFQTAPLHRPPLIGDWIRRMKITFN